MLNFLDRVENPMTDTRPADPPPMTMAELWDQKPERAVKIFLDACEGAEFEVWDLMRGLPHFKSLIELMELKASNL